VVIDDLVVFTNGVLRRLRDERETSITRAILDASADVRRAMMFATASLLLAALPVFFMEGAAGAFVKPLVMAYALAVLASMLAAATVAPALFMMLFGRSQPSPGESGIAGWISSMAAGISPAVPRAAAALAVVLTLVALALAPQLRAPVAPTFKEHDLMVHWDADPGTSHAEMSRIMARAAEELRTVPGVRSVGGHVGRAILADQVVGMHSGDLWVSVDPKADYEATVARIEDIASGYPGMDADVMTYLTARFGEVLSKVDEPIRVRLYGQRLDVLEAEAAKLSASLAGVNGIVDPRVHLEQTEPVVEIMVDLERARAHGVKPGDVRRAAAALISGMQVGNLFEEQKLFEVVVWGEPRVRHSLAAIQNLLVDAPGGRHVRLGDVAQVEIVATPQVLLRENVARYLDVVADVKGRPVTAVAADVNARLRGTVFPLEYRAELLGGFAAQEAAKLRMKWVAFAVVVGIVVVFQAAFSSWPLAFAFLVTVPMALSGSVIAAWLTGGSLSLGALAGMLTVFALAVRQGILLVQRYMNLRQSEGLDWGPELFARGAQESAASIVTSALLTAAVMAPFAIFGSRPGFEILGPMVLVVLGGLFTATTYSLCVLPAVYARFGARASTETIADDDLDLETSPEPQRI
jgi:Cu/Ag efflux pump CusA